MSATFITIIMLGFLILSEALVLLGIIIIITIFDFETPFLEPILMGLDRLKKGKCHLIVRAILISILAVLLYWVYTSVIIIRSLRNIHAPINWTDLLLLKVQILQASLAGFSLFAWMVLDKLQPIIREHHSVTKIIKAEEKLLEERKSHMVDQQRVLLGKRRVLLVKVSELTSRMKKLEMDCQMKANRAQAAGAIVLGLKNQFEEFRLKYDHSLDYNRTLRSQLQSISHEVQNIDESNMKSRLGCGGDFQRSVPPHENYGESVEFENVTKTTTKCGEYPFSATTLSSPRHRRPIFQH